MKAGELQVKIDKLEEETKNLKNEGETILESDYLTSLSKYLSNLFLSNLTNHGTFSKFINRIYVFQRKLHLRFLTPRYKLIQVL